MWEEKDLVVFSWIVNNIEDDVIADFAHHQTSKALWDNLMVTFKSKADRYLIYDLEDQAINIKQGNIDLETYTGRFMVSGSTSIGARSNQLADVSKELINSVHTQVISD